MGTEIQTSGAATLPRLISVEEAATLLAVSDTTVRNWIKNDAIPYIELPGGTERKRYRIPLQGLLTSLVGNYDLASDIEYLQTALSGQLQAAGEQQTAQRAMPRSGRPTEEEGNVKDLFQHVEGRSTQ
jgi:excisionase family DNA binding protein